MLHSVCVHKENNIAKDKMAIYIRPQARIEYFPNVFVKKKNQLSEF